jgi:hypothetical protein
MSGEPPPILLVEDNEDDIFFMRRSIKTAEFVETLHVVMDGEAAIDYLQGANDFADR